MFKFDVDGYHVELVVEDFVWVANRFNVRSINVFSTSKGVDLSCYTGVCTYAEKISIPVAVAREDTHRTCSSFS